MDQRAQDTTDDDASSMRQTSGAGAHSFTLPAHPLHASPHHLSGPLPPHEAFISSEDSGSDSCLSDPESQLWQPPPSRSWLCGADNRRLNYIPLNPQTATYRRRQPILTLRRTRIFGLVVAAVLCFVGLKSLSLPNNFSTAVHFPNILGAEAASDDAEWANPSGSHLGGPGPQSEGYELINDPTHLLVPARPLSAPPRLLRPNTARPPLPLLAQFYESGTVLPLRSGWEQPPVDLVYLFVNASSPQFEPARNAKADEEGIPMLKGRVRRWRDNGELRGSVRSGALALGPRVRRVHLLSAAFDVNFTSPGGGDEAGGDDDHAHLPLPAEAAAVPGAENITQWRLGQIPEWLDPENRANLHTHFHPSLFRLPRDDDGSLPASIAHIDEAEWQAKALPTFNSFEIESRVGWIDGLSENFIMSNDDMFMLRAMAMADFHHPLLGTVLRIDPRLMVAAELPDSLRSTSGEWGGLQHAAVLLGDRFTKKERGYVHHVPKAMSRSLVHEASVMFAEALTSSAERAFRESKRGRADIEMAWLVAHLQIERWREALLWTWAVARLGGADSLWGESARDAVREALRVERGSEGNWHLVNKEPRMTLNDLAIHERVMGWDSARHTEYIWTSFDGHPLRDPTLKLRQCAFSIHDCLGKDFFANTSKPLDAVTVFRQITFERPQCGDCLIDALMNASGPRGMSAFLPDEEVDFVPLAARGEPRAPRQWQRSEPMLPLVARWGDGDFSLGANIHIGQDAWLGSGEAPAPPTRAGVVNLRAWCLKLLSRYTYVVAQSHVKFDLMHHADDLHNTLAAIAKDSNFSMLCLNDDQPDDANDDVRISMAHWMGRMFGGTSSYVRWERPRWRWDGGGGDQDNMEAEFESENGAGAQAGQTVGLPRV